MLRQGSLHDRRRRSLLEDTTSTPDAPGGGKSRRASKAAENYTQPARSECHARWSDFVPLRNWTLAALFASGLAVIAALQAAYYFAVESPLWTAGSLAAVDLTRADSLAGWCSAVLMLASAMTAAFIYSVRRYRLDDYRGRYRVWLGASVLWAIMSIDGLADLRSAVSALGVALSGYAGPGDGVVWWLAPWSILMMWFGLRMVLDVRACRTATASLALGFAAITAGFVVPQLSLGLVADHAVMLTAACALLGRWLLFCGQVAFARHVILEAHGRLPIREARPKRDKKKAEPALDEAAAGGKATPNSTKRRDDLTTRIDPPHTTFQPATVGVDLQRPSVPTSAAAKSQPAGATAPARVAAAAGSARPAAVATKSPTRFIGGPGDDEEPTSQKLSRAERKRLRKQQRDERDDDE